MVEDVAVKTSLFVCQGGLKRVEVSFVPPFGPGPNRCENKGYYLRIYREDQSKAWEMESGYPPRLLALDGVPSQTPSPTATGSSRLLKIVAYVLGIAKWLRSGYNSGTLTSGAVDAWQAAGPGFRSRLR